MSCATVLEANTYGVHSPPTHVPPRQSRVQVPQWFVVLLRSKHVPPQLVVPVSQPCPESIVVDVSGVEGSGVEVSGGASIPVVESMPEVESIVDVESIPDESITEVSVSVTSDRAPS